MARHDRDQAAMAQASRLWDALATGTLPDPTGLDPALV